MVDYRLTETQRALQTLAHEFAEKEIRPIALQLDSDPDPAKSAYMPHLLAKADALGLRTLSIPQKYGGGGVEDLYTHCLVAEELSWGDRGVVGMLLSSLKIAHLLMDPALASEELRERYLRAYCQDENYLITTAITEPNGGSDNLLPYDAPGAGLQLVAERVGNHYVLNGMKHFISNVGWAKLHFVFARTRRDRSVSEGTTLLAVDHDTPGLKYGRVHDKLGYRLNHNQELIFENAKVPVSQRLGEENGGMIGVRKVVRGDGIVNAAGFVGLARAAYEAALAYAKERVQGGKPIIQHQLIGAKLVDMYTQVEAARALTLRAAWYADHRDEVPFDPKVTGTASFFTSEVAFEVARRAVEIFGAYGIMKELPIQKYLRDAASLLHSDGGNTLKRLRAIPYL